MRISGRHDDEKLFWILVFLCEEEEEENNTFFGDLKIIDDEKLIKTRKKRISAK